LADQVLPSGEPWDGCARTYLKQAIAAAAAEGYTVAAAFEPEFTLGRRESDPGGGPDRLVPVDDSLCYSATGFHLAHDFAMDLLGALTAQGLRPEHYYPELGALTCGSVNSYRRLAPQMWSSAYTIYGMDNREAAVRICSPMSDDRAKSVNLELKPSDSSGNPYLALGAVIHAGLDGIRRK